MSSGYSAVGAPGAIKGQAEALEPSPSPSAPSSPLPQKTPLTHSPVHSSPIRKNSYGSVDLAEEGVKSPTRVKEEAEEKIVDLDEDDVLHDGAPSPRHFLIIFSSIVDNMCFLSYLWLEENLKGRKRGMVRRSSEEEEKCRPLFPPLSFP